MARLGTAETLSTRVSASVVAFDQRLGGVLNLTLTHDFYAIGLTDEDLVALARWAPDDWSGVIHQRLYAILSLGHAGLCVAEQVRAWPEYGRVGTTFLVLQWPSLAQPDAMILARLAAVALHDRGEG